MAKVEDREAERGSYSSQTAREQGLAPSNFRNEYEYAQYWIRWGDWAQLDGRRRETRDPAIEAVAIIECGAQKLGFGEFAERPNAGILTYKQKYVDFLIDEGEA